MFVRTSKHSPMVHLILSHSSNVSLNPLYPFHCPTKTREKNPPPILARIHSPASVLVRRNPFYANSLHPSSLSPRTTLIGCPRTTENRISFDVLICKNRPLRLRTIKPVSWPLHDGDDDADNDETESFG